VAVRNRANRMRRLTRFPLVLVCASLATAIISMAQAASEVPANHSYLEPLSAPDSKSGAPSFLDSASIQAGTSDTKATLAFQGYLPHFPHTDYLHYEIGGEAPISKGSTDEVDIGTVSGLTAGSSAHVQFSAIIWPKSEADSDLDFTAFCEDSLKTLIPGYSVASIAASGADPQCGRPFLTPENLQRVVKVLNSAIKDCNEKDETKRTLKLAAVACEQILQENGGKPAALIPDALNDKYLKHLAGDRIAEFERTAKPLTLITLGTTVNRRKAAYFNQSDLTTLVKDQVTGYGASFGISRLAGNAMYSGGLSYEKTFKDGDSVEFCSPVNNSTTTKCATGALDAPTHKFARIAFLESRVLIKTGAFAIAPRIEYDFTGTKFAAKLPLYIAPNKDKVLTGGISLGYATKGKDDKKADGFGAMLFVSKAFSFFD
jgi:hypothetical protein